MPSKFMTFAMVSLLSLTTLAPLTAANDANSPFNDISFAPNTDLKVLVTRAAAAPRIDGRLDDAVWTNARVLENFTEVDPGDNVRPKVKTQAMIAYDDENLYVGFNCSDDPKDIRATITDRDGIFRDDFVGIMIDTFKDQQNGYEFFVNPHGIQGDLRRTGNNEDSSYDTVWQSAGRINDDGWSAEIAIPFRSLRFPDAEDQAWGLHIMRIRPRDSREQISWAPISRDDDCFFCQAGNMEGLVGVNQGRNLELLPYVIGSQAGSLSGDEETPFTWNNGSADGDVGLGVKYGITSNLTADLTYNPDFSQIEADAAQINVNNSFALFFPERRPFFLEGSDIFNTRVSTVYTRSINDPIFAAKATGKVGKTTVGFITAKDDVTPYTNPFEEQSQVTTGEESYSNIFRAKHDILKDSYIGVIATERHATSSTGFNATYGVDTELRLLQDWRLLGHVQGSTTTEPDDTTMTADYDNITFGADNQFTSRFDGEKFDGVAADVVLSRSGRSWNSWLWYENYSPTFRAETGFVTHNNYEEVGAWNGYLFRFEDHPFLEIVEPQFSWGRELNRQGVFKDTWYEPAMWVRFKKQTRIWTNFIFSDERYNNTLVTGIRRWQGEINTDFTKAFSGGVWMRRGRGMIRDDAPRLGMERAVQFWSTIKPSSQLRLNLDVAWFAMDELNDRTDPDSGDVITAGSEVYNTYVARLRTQYQLNRRLFLRVVTQYVDSSQFFSVDPLVSYKINPFTVFFVGSSHSFSDYDRDVNTGRDIGYKQTDRVFFVKFQYLFRV